MGSWPGGISAITIVVEDVQEARRFYQDVFGLPVAFETDDSVVFKFGETLVNLLASSSAAETFAPVAVAPPGAGSRTMFTIEVGDVDETSAELSRRGVALLSGPMDRPWGPRTATFVDPGGNMWEIAH